MSEKIDDMSLYQIDTDFDAEGAQITYQVYIPLHYPAGTSERTQAVEDIRTEIKNGKLVVTFVTEGQFSR